jgi:hypothetical protein
MHPGSDVDVRVASSHRCARREAQAGDDDLLARSRVLSCDCWQPDEDTRDAAAATAARVYRHQRVDDAERSRARRDQMQTSRSTAPLNPQYAELTA